MKYILILIVNEKFQFHVLIKRAIKKIGILSTHMHYMRQKLVNKDKRQTCILQNS